MSDSQLSARTAAGGILMMDATTSKIVRVYSFLYYPDSISRTVTPQAAGTDYGDRLDALRLRGPAVETVRVDLDLDATDWLETPTLNPASQLAAEFGLLPQLAVLETVLSPTSKQLTDTQNDLGAGIIEISPVEALLTIFVWSRRRVVPVRITELTAEEQTFDTSLNPIRVRASLSMRVLSTNDLPFTHPGATVYLQHLQQQEALVKRVPEGRLSDVGLTSLAGG